MRCAREATRRYVRRLAPSVGAGYELWDLAVLAATLVLASYLLAVPSTAQSTALAWLIGPVSLQVVGYGLSGAMVAAVVCAYDPRTVPIGRALVMATGFAWSGVLLLGWIADVDAADGRAVGLVPALVLGLWTAAVAVSVMVYGGGRTWRYLLSRSAQAGVLVGGVVAVVGALGDPRPLSVAVLYGYLARSAAHQGEVAQGEVARC